MAKRLNDEVEVMVTRSLSNNVRMPVRNRDMMNAKPMTAWQDVDYDALVLGTCVPARLL